MSIPRNRLRIRTALAATLAGALALAATGCSAQHPAASASGGRGAELTAAVANAPTTLDPALLGAGDYMMWASELAYDPLIRLDGDGTFSPDLATKWGYSDSSNTRFDLTIRTGVTFADGTALTSEAVAASLNYSFKAPGATQGFAPDFSAATATGSDQVQIACTAACPEMPFLLSQNIQLGSIISPAGLANPKALATASYGAGPYVLDATRSVSGDHYTFVANKRYWNPKAIHFDRIVYRVITDPTARVAALRSGSVDVINDVPAQSIDSLKSSGYHLTTPETGFSGILFLDREGTLAKPLGDVRVRQALNYAIDRDQINKTLGYGHATSTGQMTGAGSGAFVPSLDSTYPYDPTKAKRLLAEAGYPHGFALTVETQAPIPNAKSYALAVASQWAAVGVKVNLVSDATITAWLDTINSKKVPAASYLYGTLPFPLQALSFYSGEGGPFDGFTEDPKVTAWLKQASTLPPAQADAIYKQINTYAVQQAFAAPLAQTQVGYASGPKFTMPAASSINAVPILTDVEQR